VRPSDVLNTNKKAHTGEKAKLRETEALDLVTLELNDEKLTVGRERHRFCDPLSDPGVSRYVPLWRCHCLGTMKRRNRTRCQASLRRFGVLGKVEVDQRQYILTSPAVAGGLLATGDMASYAKGLSICGSGTVVVF